MVRKMVASRSALFFEISMARLIVNYFSLYIGYKNQDNSLKCLEIRLLSKNVFFLYARTLCKKVKGNKLGFAKELCFV